MGRKLYNKFINKEFLRFVIIGAVNTVHSFLYSTLYSCFADANAAFVLGYLTALVLGYLLNARFTFHAPPAWGALCRYAVSYIPNFLLQNVIVYVVYNLLGIHKLVAYGLAAVLGIPITFLLVKVFAFGRKHKN